MATTRWLCPTTRSTSALLLASNAGGKDRFMHSIAIALRVESWAEQGDINSMFEQAELTRFALFIK